MRSVDKRGGLDSFLKHSKSFGIFNLFSCTFSSDNDILLLNKLVKDDGTIQLIENNFLNKDEVKEIISNKVEKQLDKNFDKWLQKNIPDYLDKYFKKQ